MHWVPLKRQKLDDLKVKIETQLNDEFVDKFGTDVESESNFEGD
jgi:hypothetical protein